MGWSVGITLAVFGAEFIGGYMTHSLALLSDAWHVLADALALIISWWAIKQAKKSSTLANTFGFHRSQVVAGFVNGLSLLVISGWVLIEAVQRLFYPIPVLGKEMFIIATVGLVANLLIALLLNGHAHDDMNIKSAFLHVLGDALASVGVIVAGVLMMKYQWYLADPIISIAIALMIVRSAYGVTRQAFHILMEGSPVEVDLSLVLQRLGQVPGVSGVHDLHVWNITEAITCLAVHIEVAAEAEGDTVLRSCNELLEREFHIGHSTIQLERQDYTGCTRRKLTCSLVA
ncbi:cation diffusion facilitator family transporter [Desulfotomaculum varum]